MSYCTVADVVHEMHPTLELNLREHYSRIHSGDPSRPDFEETIQDHIVKAEACANASLARAYRVPLKKATNIVVSAVCKIALYYAAAAFSEKEEITKDKYETAMQMLDWLVEAEDATLVDDEAEDDSNRNFIGAKWGTDPRIFTSEELKKW